MVMDRFYFSNGENAGSLEEFILKLRLVDDECFHHHVNEGRNDFVPWIRKCVKDKVLAKKVERLKDKEEIIKAVKKRLQEPAKVKEGIIDKIKHAIFDED